MCGRFAYFGNGVFGYETLLLPDPPPFEDYNIPPTRDILTIRTSLDSGNPEYALLHWGLIPFWSKTSKTKFPLINARSEGIETKSSYRGPIKKRRCIVPASGFYEWLRTGKQKTPYFIRRSDGGYMAMAGVWDHWLGEDGEEIESCSIITIGANKLMQELHDRMPVILDKNELSTWLNPDLDLKSVLTMLTPCPDQWIESYPVNSKVNSVKNNDPECVERMTV